MTRAQQCLQRRNGELRRAAKDEAHRSYHSPALLHFADLAQEQVALERAYAKDEEDAVEMIDLVLEGARQQLFAIDLKPLAVHILARTRTFAARDTFSRISGRLRQPSSSFCLPSLVDDFGIDENDLVFRIFLEAEVDDREPFRNADLRRGQPDAMGRVHATRTYRRPAVRGSSLNSVTGSAGLLPKPGQEISRSSQNLIVRPFQVHQ